MLGDVLKRPSFLPVPSFGPKLLLGLRTRRRAAVRRPTCDADGAPRRRFRVRAPDPRAGAASRARSLTTRRMATDVTGDRPVVVVGAGLAGLACATTLHRAGRAVRVVEASDGVGGRVRTDRVDGFRLDRGFQVLLTAYPEAHRQLDLEALDLRRFDPGALVHLGAEHSVIADPFRAPSRLIDADPQPGGDAHRQAADRARCDVAYGRSTRPASSAATTIPTIEVLREAGFSDRTIDRFFSPLFGGIQLDPTLTTSRRMFDVIFRMLADGDSAVPAAGMQAIPDQLAARLPDGSIELGTPRDRSRRAGSSTDRRADRSRPIGRRRLRGSGGGAPAGPPDGRIEVGRRRLLRRRRSAHRREAGRARRVRRPGAQRRRDVERRADRTRRPVVTSSSRRCPGHIGDDLASTARRSMRAWWGGQVDRLGTPRDVSHRSTVSPPTRSAVLDRSSAIDLGDGLYVCGDHRDTASIQGALYSGSTVCRGDPRHTVTTRSSDDDQALTSSTSSSICTFSPTSTPPVSSGAFHSMPQSLRLIVAVALNPARVPPHGS